MQERRTGARLNISLPIRVKWKGEDGKEMMEDGLTENVGQSGTLIFLPRNLPKVGSKVNITITESGEEVNANAQVIRLERNVAHPQCALLIVDSLRAWKKHVFEYAADLIANQKPEEFEDW